MHDSFEDVKVDDVIIIATNQGERLATVERLTTKQFVTVSGTKFWKKDGRGVGCDIWNNKHAMKPRSGQIKMCRDERVKRHLIENIKRKSLQRLDLEQLKRLDAIFNETSK